MSSSKKNLLKGIELNRALVYFWERGNRGTLVIWILLLVVIFTFLPVLESAYVHIGSFLIVTLDYEVDYGTKVWILWNLAVLLPLFISYLAYWTYVKGFGFDIVRRTGSDERNYYPSHSEISEKMIEGFKLWAIELIYKLPGLFFVVVLITLPVRGIVVLLLFILGLGLLSLINALFLPFANYRYFEKRKFSAAFNFREVYRLFLESQREYLGIGLGLSVLWLIRDLFLIVMIILFSVYIGFLFYPAFVAFTTIALAYALPHLYGQLYRIISERINVQR